MRHSRLWEPGEDISPLQTAFAAAHRIPFLSTRYPTWYYITGIIVGDEGIGGEVPTDEEIELVASARDAYVDRYYPGPLRDPMRERAPYDIDGEAVGFFFLKRGEGSWVCQRSSRVMDYPIIHPNFWDAPMTLEAVITWECVGR